MSEEKTLVHGQRIRTSHWQYEPKVTVGTLQGSARKDAATWKEPEAQTVMEALARECLRAARVGQKPMMAWAMSTGTMITSDYPGKAEEMRKESEAYRNAAELKDGEIVVIEGLRYFVRMRDKGAFVQHSDPLDFEVIPEYPDYN